MKKVLVVSNMFPDIKNPSYGIFVKRFCNQLDSLNIAYDIIYMKKTKNKFLKSIRYFVFYLKSFVLYFSSKYSKVYIHYASHSSLGIILANIFLKKDIFVNLHGSDVVPENEKQKRMQKFTLKIIKISKKIIVPSLYFKNYVITKYDVKSDNIYIYPSCGVDFKVFYKESPIKIREFKREFNIPENKLVFGFVGRISHNKGWDTLIEAIKLIDDENIIFVIVGTGNEEMYLNEKLKYITTNNVVRFPLLEQEKLMKIYNCFDCFIFPTKREGESLGLVGLEAMACGCPIIASDYAAPKYYVNEKNGLKFEVGNAYELKNRILDFKKINSHSKELMSRNAILTANDYDSEKILRILDELMR